MGKGPKKGGIDAEMKPLARITGGGMKAEDITGQMADQIKTVIYDYAAKYPSRITLASALGVLQIVALVLLDEHKP